MKDPKDMTRQELIAAARIYDDGINEGDRNGYNPFRAELHRRAYDEQPIPPKLARQERIDALTRKLAYYSGTTTDAELESWRSERAKLQAEADAEFLADWPLELTRQRRREWAAWVRANAKGGKVAARDVAAQIKRQGWGREALKRAVQLHGIEGEKV